MKSKVKIILLIAAAVTSTSCAPSRPASTGTDYEALSRPRVNCPAPTRAMINPWGMNGKSDGCYLREGPFVAAEGGYVRIRGQFTRGKATGIWRYYDEHGAVVKEINQETSEDATR